MEYNFPELKKDLRLQNEGFWLHLWILMEKKFLNANIEEERQTEREREEWLSTWFCICDMKC